MYVHICRYLSYNSNITVICKQYNSNSNLIDNGTDNQNIQIERKYWKDCIDKKERYRRNKSIHKESIINKENKQTSTYRLVGIGKCIDKFWQTIMYRKKCVDKHLNHTSTSVKTKKNV